MSFFMVSFRYFQAELFHELLALVDVCHAVEVAAFVSATPHPFIGVSGVEVFLNRQFLQ